MIKIQIINKKDQNKTTFLTLPTTKTQIKKALQKITAPNKKDHYIKNYHSTIKTLKLNKTKPINKLNKLAYNLSTLNTQQQKILTAYLEIKPKKINKTIKQIDKINLYNNMTLKKVAKEHLKNTNLGTFAYTLKKHIKYKKLTKQMQKIGYKKTTKGIIHKA